ncbi:Fe2+ transport system protein B FeoB [Methanonatronarchaeum thermophilum]|uniref:Fe2+ transport system protein B FeoB n=1 Tax=Methanonatronarchaeum thermophilum TaxID=1927129 RepID=A0A1Y3GAL2_9EURY|nr:ferrous iron transporter B [Methanonatronarchaeum thermophilum]OUJ18458.1 Fe2+ transport system protein B FeoB [Methanonatronarchaeum thermophilum]
MSVDRVLLVGPPNVGKSVFFNNFTGLDTGIANYAGTTIEYKVGSAVFDGREVRLIDVPGVYTLDATNEAEEVAIDMLDSDPDGVVCVLDAANLESSVYLLMQVLQRGIPVVVAVNRVDLLRQRGDSIDFGLLSRRLGVPVVPTVAIKGEGFDKVGGLVRELLEIGGERFSGGVDRVSWDRAEQVVDEVLSRGGGLDREGLGELLVKPWPGLPVAFLVLAFTFGVIVGVGMGLRRFLLLPFFEGLVFPPIVGGVESLVAEGVFRDILIGEYGFLIKGLEWPFALVLPYVFSFYLALTLLEESGYLPRLAVLLDGLLGKIGLSGGNVIPLLLSYGCAIPGITATRTAGSRQRRVVLATMICMAVPCIAQTGAFIALLAEVSLLAVVGLFAVHFGGLVVVALVMGRLLGTGGSLDVVELPVLLSPDLGMLWKKWVMRMKGFILDGAVPLVGAVGAASVLYETGVLKVLGRVIEPLVTEWLLLPSEAAVPLILGVVRRELTVLPLIEMELTVLQLFVASLVGLFYIPCIAVLAILAKEFSLRMTVGVLLATTVVAFTVGGVVARIGLLI